MAIVADVSVPPDSVPLHELFAADADATVTFERLVPLGGQSPSVVRVESDLDDVAGVARSARGVTEVAEIDGAGDVRVFECRLEPDAGGVLRVLSAATVHVLTASGAASEWRFRLLCANRRALSMASERVTERGVPVTLDRVRSLSDDESESFSGEQREAVLTAYDRGYFEVPRRTTVEELATDVGISDTAFSQRLRRGLSALVRLARSERLIDDA